MQILHEDSKCYMLGKNQFKIAPLTLYRNQVVFWVFSALLKGFFLSG